MCRAHRGRRPEHRLQDTGPWLGPVSKTASVQDQRLLRVDSNHPRPDEADCRVASGSSFCFLASLPNRGTGQDPLFATGHLGVVAYRRRLSAPMFDSASTASHIHAIRRRETGGGAAGLAQVSQVFLALLLLPQWCAVVITPQPNRKLSDKLPGCPSTRAMCCEGVARLQLPPGEHVLA